MEKREKNDVWFSRFHCWAFELTSHYFKLFDGGNKDEIKGHFKIKFNDKKIFLMIMKNSIQLDLNRNLVKGQVITATKGQLIRVCD